MKITMLSPPAGRRFLWAALALAAPLGLIAAAWAEPPPHLPQPTSGPAAREQLEALRAEQKQAAEREARLRKEIEAFGEDRRKLNEALIGTAARIRGDEERIGATETRLRTLEGNQSTIRKSLDGRRSLIVEILAALQRMGHRPPPAILVSPQDALLSVHTAMLLGAVLPQMRGEAEKLTADLAELVRVRTAMAAERDDLARDVAALSEERHRMSLLIEERQKKQAEAEKALETERQRAIALARQADSLKDLIAKLEQDVALSARPPGTAARPQEGKEIRGNLASLKDPGRLAPAVAFASAKGALPLPINGVKIRDFGAPDGLGGTEKGLWIASRAGAQVTAPCDGWVVYAGPFRSYGQLLILNAGGGYHVLLAGMERISVDLGQSVLTGEPVAVMGGGPQSAAAIAVGSSQPVLYVEFRKDGTPVDPNPWWATKDSEKVRG
ncbi:MAG TPA: peptidoglycan DD-metalloendopeptidase family protein [Xanthobacteraceae bacterium]